MTKQSLLAVAALAVAALTGLPATACNPQAENCGTNVPQFGYAGGGIQVQTVAATACFTPQVSYDITLADGYVEFVAAFVYGNERSHERIKAVRGRVAQRGQLVCWEHNVPIGTHMAVWVTCQTTDGLPYEGWAAVKVTGPGTYTMVLRPDWNWRPSWL